MRIKIRQPNPCYHCQRKHDWCQLTCESYAIKKKYATYRCLNIARRYVHDMLIIHPFISNIILIALILMTISGWKLFIEQKVVTFMVKIYNAFMH